MSGYEKLNYREANLLWDAGKERELDDFIDVELQKASLEPCDLYGVCRECPNFDDCFNLSTPQVSSKVII